MGGYSAFTLFALAGYLFAAIFLCVGYYLRAKIRRHVASAQVAKGTVISLEAATAMSSDSLQQVFHPVFSFRDAQGIEHRVRASAGTYPTTHKVGDSVEVFYHPQSPHEAIIDQKGFIQMARVCFFAGIVAVVIATIIMILERRS
jgi:hypothetical protein